jgi:alpha-amylase/alpha-mannosidase (GH57 family)
MAASPLSVVIHGHFYQPPRDDPWLETVEAQPSAEPFHDWNERVTEECYRAVVAARVPGPHGRIAAIVNTLELISFNFGPTLLEWLEGEAPQTYRSILGADAKSAKALGGHGNAIAQAYHHTILPLASRREKVSEVRWGMADFRKRFGRDPVGMWLPETAVDGMTLDVLAQEGIAFTIVGPDQVEEPPPNGLPGLYRASSGRTLALFVYNGPLSHGVAFGSLLDDAAKWAKDIVGPTGDKSARAPASEERPDGKHDPGRLISIATDGETYGHHHRFGEMALAAVLDLLQKDMRVRVENFSSFLSRNPPKHEVELVEPSSWSCVHGIERWRSDCGCKMDPAEETQQAWRGGLRDAVEWLASQIHQIYESEGPPLLGDPWAARNAYGPSAEAHTKHPRALELLELERQALRLFTSCGWFFDDLAGIEPLQLLRYAARALELTGPKREELEEGFLKRLDTAFSNENPPRNGRAIFLEEAKPRVPAHFRVAAGAALWEAVTTSTGVAEGTADPGPDHPKEAQGGNQLPGVAGFHVARVKPDLFRITQKRTGRWWGVETRIHRPSSGGGAVAVRAIGEGEEFIPLDLKDVPEGFRIPITNALTEEVPDLSQALVSAVENLEQGGKFQGPPPMERVERVRDLADLHILLDVPIPFDAQTTFFRILEEAPPQAGQRLAVLRDILGFTPAT